MSDRTREFLSIVREYDKTSKSSASSSNSKVQSRSAFQEAAGEIARGIHRTSKSLSNLSKLVQRQGLFDDPTEEINSLIFRIKQELADLNSKCDSAQQYVDSQKSSRSEHGQGAHHGKVVSQLKTGLASATKDFKSVLEVRSSKIKESGERKEALTGSGVLSPMQKVSGSSSGGYALPYGAPPDPDSVSQPAQSSESRNVYSDAFNPALQEQQMLLAPPTQYFAEREKAVSEVESTIAELGTLFKRLSTMIAEQGELVERIDEDIENAVSTVDSASDVLQKAYDAASSNTTLYTKLGGILLFFLLFFTIFLM
eukprot:GSChrysophyteH1.ASY1.ANO1.2896.1 assembled CDS